MWLNERNGGLYGASAKVIESFTKNIKLDKPQTKRLQLVTNDNLIDKPNAIAFVIITPPQTVIIDPNNDTDAIEIESIKLPLTYSTDSFYTEHKFDKEGIYQIQYEISDIAGDKYRSDLTTLQVGNSENGIEYVETLKQVQGDEDSR